MYRNRFLRISPILLLPLVILACGKKPVPPPPPPPAPEPAPVVRPAPPAPTITLSASPSSIERGQQSTLSWSASNANSVVIDGGVGNVAPNGSMVVSPSVSTTYTAVARGEGGEDRASTRVTVVEPEQVPVVVVSDQQRLKEAIENGEVKPIFFAYDKALITEDSKGILQKNAAVLKRYPEAKVIIEGHCDERGTEAYNLALGDRRASATREHLLELGVQSEQMDTISYGEERPFASGTTQEAYDQNRRAHFVAK